MEKKTVAIVTLYNERNFGNRLQNYAVHKYFEHYGLVPTTLRCDAKEHHTFRYNIKNLIPLRKAFHVITYFTGRGKRRRHNIVQERLRSETIKGFSEQYLTLSHHFSFCKIPKEIQDQFDYYVTGSDQVWHGWSGDHTREELEYYFLRFAQRNKRLSVSPSFGWDELPEKDAQTYKDGLEGFDYLCIREEHGAEIIRKIAGKDATVLLDPTMLIDDSEWIRILRKPHQYTDDGYIFVYALDGFDGETKRAVELFARESSLCVVDIMDMDSDYYVNTRPDEFLYWIYHATLVITDSFHACAFSILFNRPFAVFDRRNEKCRCMGDRIDTLLSKFDLKDRRFGRLQPAFFDKSRWSELFSAHYDCVPAILEKERLKAKDFYDKCFHLND